MWCVWQQTFVVHIHLFEQVVTDRLDGFQTQPMDIRRCIISSKSCQVDTCDSLQQPGSLQDKHTDMAPNITENTFTLSASSELSLIMDSCVTLVFLNYL